MSEQPFYIGWQPGMARGLKSFAIGAMVFSISFAMVTAALIASGQSSAGTGRWDTAQIEVLEGVLQIDPYPIVVQPGPQPRSVVPRQQRRFR